MSVVLRPYQASVEQQVHDSWAAGNKNVLLVLPTGAGKTVTLSEVVRKNRGGSCVIAHRQELVLQLSLALARDSVRHRVIGPASVVKLCVTTHMREIGKSYYDAGAECAVAGVDTLILRADGLERWAGSVTLWVQDEAHHVVVGNKWGTAASMFPNARGLGVTATPLRADGKGLGREFDGVFDDMIVGPGMRNLIGMGYLTDYRVFAPKTDINMATVAISNSTGDYNQTQLRNAVHRSKIVGDVVDHYLRIARGKSGVTFATDVEGAKEISDRFNASGVPSEVVSAKTPDAERTRAVQRFRSRELLQLVNVDLFGEGFDLPAIEVVSMARPTESYGLYVQQFGRALRLLEGKTTAIVIDHVGNVVRHGLPDRPRVWSLASREKRGSQLRDPDETPVRACPECTGVYERVLVNCPYCGYKPVPTDRSGPELVDGDLSELSPEVLRAMRGEVEKVDMPLDEYRVTLEAKFMPVIGQLAAVKRHAIRQEAQRVLRDHISLWAGHQRAAGRSDQESYRRFYHRYGIDVLGAQALGTAEATELSNKIAAEVAWKS